MGNDLKELKNILNEFKKICNTSLVASITNFEDITEDTELIDTIILNEIVVSEVMNNVKSLLELTNCFNQKEKQIFYLRYIKNLRIIEDISTYESKYFISGAKHHLYKMNEKLLEEYKRKKMSNNICYNNSVIN